MNAHFPRRLSGFFCVYSVLIGLSSAAAGLRSLVLDKARSPQTARPLRGSFRYLIVADTGDLVYWRSCHRFCRSPLEWSAKQSIGFAGRGLRHFFWYGRSADRFRGPGSCLRHQERRRSRRSAGRLSCTSAVGPPAWIDLLQPSCSQVDWRTRGPPRAR